MNPLFCCHVSSRGWPGVYESSPIVPTCRLVLLQSLNSLSFLHYLSIFLFVFHFSSQALQTAAVLREVVLSSLDMTVQVKTGISQCLFYPTIPARCRTSSIVSKFLSDKFIARLIILVLVHMRRSSYFLFRTHVPAPYTGTGWTTLP